MSDQQINWYDKNQPLAMALSLQLLSWALPPLIGASHRMYSMGKNKLSAVF